MNYPDVPYHYALPEYRYQAPPSDPMANPSCTSKSLAGVDSSAIVPAITACSAGTPNHPAFPKFLEVASPLPQSYKLVASGKGVVYGVNVILLENGG